jgi:hypothetical protein
MTRITDAFSASYREARDKFLAAARQAGLPVRSYAHPLKGRDGEDLAMDVVVDGAPGSRKMLIVSSACHGVEGYCGTGVQVFSLHDAELREKARAQDVAVLYVHALNPHGFSWVRRVTHENVDLNRNFHDYGKPLPVNLGYREIHDLLLPDAWPPDAANKAAVSEYLATRGEKAYQAAISGGQYEFEDGLFFGGKAATWSNQTIRQVLRDHAAGVEKLAWIDLHTGLGPSGLGERIFANRDDKAAYERASAWWGGAGKTPVTSMYDGSSTSAVLTGMMFAAAYEECPQAEYTGMAMEYGTLPVLQVMQALRADHWLHNHPGADAALAREIKQGLMDAFYTNTDVWKTQIVTQARESMLQAVDGLSGR